LRRRIPSSRKARIRCPKRSSIASLKLVVGYPKEETTARFLDRTIGDTDITIAP
jgi:hypothetical protein